MQTRHLVSAAAIALLFSASGAFAADGCRTGANGVQVCDVHSTGERSREDVVAEMHASHADTSTGCRTIANGVQKCDVATGHEAVLAGVQGKPTSSFDGCRTIANGVQKCDVPAPMANTAVAKLH